MEYNVNEFLNFRTETRKQIEVRENQWKVDEQSFVQKDKQLQDQIWELEGLQRQNSNDKSKAEESKRLDINNHNVDIKSRLDQFKRQITLSSLKHLYSTDKIEYQRERGYRYAPDDFKEEVVYDTPLVKIFALFGKNDKPTNQVEYTLKCFTHLPLKRTINPLMIREKNHGKYYFSAEDDVLITQKSFKTLEEAEQYHARNKAKLIRDYVPQIDALMSEIQNAEDDFDKVFDFRLIDIEDFNRTNTIKNITKNRLEFTWTKTDWSFREKVTESGDVVVNQSGFEFQTEGDLEYQNLIMQKLVREYFIMPHLYEEAEKMSKMRDVYVSEKRRLAVLAMSDEQLMRERYLETKEDVRAFRDRLNSGKWTIDPYWSARVIEKEAV